MTLNERIAALEAEADRKTLLERIRDWFRYWFGYDATEEVFNEKETVIIWLDERQTFDAVWKK